ASAAGSPIVFVMRGYAVLDNPTIPIVGEGTREPNDSYVEQLVAGAKAAVDELVRRGVGDRDRMAISGHSYGAFMTANLLAHSDLFRAGIARSGAYNRTLTPFSFQAEERTYWEAPGAGARGRGARAGWSVGGAAGVGGGGGGVVVGGPGGGLWGGGGWGGAPPPPQDGGERPTHTGRCLVKYKEKRRRLTPSP